MLFYELLCLLCVVGYTCYVQAVSGAGIQHILQVVAGIFLIVYNNDTQLTG
jgi:hypothetical protein